MLMMRRHAHQIGAVFYALWGILHALGGAAILVTLNTEGGRAALEMLATAAPRSELLQSTTPVLDHLIAYHAFNILWIGLFATVVATRFNWRNRPAGYWANLVVVSIFDLGLIVFEVLPGSIAASDAILGGLLWIPAVVFSTIGIQTEVASSPPDTQTLETNLTPDT